MQKITIKKCSDHDPWPVLVLDGNREVWRCRNCKHTEVRDVQTSDQKQAA